MWLIRRSFDANLAKFVTSVPDDIAGDVAQSGWHAFTWAQTWKVPTAIREQRLA
jgi:hypothetical protein